MEESMLYEREEFSRHTRAPATRCIQIRDAPRTRNEARGRNSWGIVRCCARRGDIGAPVSVADSLRVRIAARSTLRSPLMFRKWERMTIDGCSVAHARARARAARQKTNIAFLPLARARVCVCVCVPSP